jgi:hypothetical protein
MIIEFTYYSKKGNKKTDKFKIVVDDRLRGGFVKYKLVRFCEKTIEQRIKKNPKDKKDKGVIVKSKVNQQTGQIFFPIMRKKVIEDGKEIHESHPEKLRFKPQTDDWTKEAFEHLKTTNFYNQRFEFEDLTPNKNVKSNSNILKKIFRWPKI